jgi:hypothetical protein
LVQTNFSCLPAVESELNIRLVALLLPLVVWLRHYGEPFRHYCALLREIHMRLISDLFSNLPNVMFKADDNERGMNVAIIRYDVSCVINQQ